mgnify:CR=1 FL=1
MTSTGLPTTLPGAQADTLMWAHPDEIEPAALEQLTTCLLYTSPSPRD